MKLCSEAFAIFVAFAVFTCTVQAQCVALTITNQPLPKTVSPCSAVTFAAGVSGTLGSFQWFSNNTAIPNATNSSYTILQTTRTANGSQFYLIASNSCSAVTSAVATLSITLASTPPNLVYARGDATMSRVILAFNSETCPTKLNTNSAESVSNYTVSGGVVISNATLVQGTNVVLNTSGLTPGTIYVVTATNIADGGGIPNIGHGTAQFQAWVQRPGSVPGTFVPPQLVIERQTSTAKIFWPPGGVLQSASDVIGPWTDILNAANPHTISATNSSRFFRTAFPP